MAGPAGAGGGSGQKRGRPAANPANNAAHTEAAAAGAATPSQPSLGPSLQVHNNFAGKHLRAAHFRDSRCAEHNSIARALKVSGIYFSNMRWISVRKDACFGPCFPAILCLEQQRPDSTQGCPTPHELTISSEELRSWDMQPQEQNNKRIVMALQSGLKGELAWAINSLTLLSFKEKDDSRKDATPLAKVPGLLDSLLHVIDEWRDVAHERVFAKLSRPRVLGVDQPYTGFGLEYEIGSTDDPMLHIRAAADKHQAENGSDAADAKEGWCWDEEGLFNLDEIGRHERQQCAVAVSNILRNFSFMPENEASMAQHRRCLETLIQCMEDHETEDEELVTNSVETILNLAPFLCLKIFSDKPNTNRNVRSSMTEKRAVEAIMTMLESPLRAWHCSAAELLGRLIVNPDNEPFLLPFVSQVYQRLVELLGLAPDAQAAAVAALYNFAEINTDCRLRLASERWAVGRLLRVVQTPHHQQEVCRKAALTLESLASEPQNRAVMLSYESSIAELAVVDQRMSDVFARILWELSSGISSKMGSLRGVWGSS